MVNPVSLIYQVCHFMYDVLFNSSAYEKIRSYDDIFREKLGRIQECQVSVSQKVHEAQKNLSDITTLSDRVDRAWRARKTLCEKHYQERREQYAYLQKFAPIAAFLDTVATLSQGTRQDCERLDSFLH